MPLNAFLRSFTTVFAAELGDKTQIAVLCLAASERAPAAVFLGATLGLAAATGLGVLVGTFLGATLPERWVRLGAGVLFVSLGVWFVFGALREH
jgi:putative Ca2+/H+ antiporter (TMEM165/GDT1 family)